MTSCVFMQNMYPMDLRSAHKVPEKPPPRLRLSLTRSVGAELEPGVRPCRPGERPGVLRRLEKRRSKQGVARSLVRDLAPPRLQRVPYHTEDPMEGDGRTRKKEDQGDHATEQSERREITLENHKTDQDKDIPGGRCGMA